MDYTTLKQNGYANTYAVVNFTTGEVYTTACEVGAYALRAMYKRFDGCRRYEPAHLVLVNCVTGVVLEEVGA
jgi:hypothetical protein